MNLLLQINGDLPDRFLGHERRLYIWACKRKTCRRKDGSLRGFRATRQTKVQQSASTTGSKKPEATHGTTAAAPTKINLGETLFGVKPSSKASANLFTSPSGSGAQSNTFAAAGSQNNPFASASSLAAKPPQKPFNEPTSSLTQSFADKARISTPSQPIPQLTPTPSEPWPSSSSFPEPYHSLHLDADKEYIDPEPVQAPSGVRVDTGGEGSSSSGGLDKEAFESSMDRTFQKFADRLSQNPEQVLRYEFGGQPLLYSRKDAAGKLLAPAQEKKDMKVKVQSSGGSNIPRCGNCRAERVFELQLTPHLISELEAEEMGLDGMDWGTVILAVCSKDCQEPGKGEEEVGYVEEWTGVQWEELAGKR
ncbi:hypothetical protein DOTSEDRAFT_74853 [Dothistroma septosporum NZE10]|uniref:Programmed cell death protein 2 C-terminal domain-containing protein n=1 Tax=Dothistroma septosporum (strain NZE10 / CBS 128990) TaxID=675120 RepID=N1PCF8_DOTSN|nr:hypothetical protein DOTSEDRAFT_74853 [Dothistroma septosporum NZE10]